MGGNIVFDYWPHTTFDGIGPLGTGDKFDPDAQVPKRSGSQHDKYEKLFYFTWTASRNIERVGLCNNLLISKFVFSNSSFIEPCKC